MEKLIMCRMNRDLIEELLTSRRLTVRIWNTTFVKYYIRF